LKSGGNEYWESHEYATAPGLSGFSISIAGGEEALRNHHDVIRAEGQR
jgi:hypothetical protein